MSDEKPEETPQREHTDVGPDVGAQVAQLRHELLQRPERGADGRFVSNVANADLLDRSQLLMRRIAPLREEIADSLLSDWGLSRVEATQSELMVARDLALCELIQENLIAAELESAASRNRVPFTTAKGRTATVVARLLAVMDRKLKLIQLAGMERRAKPAQSIGDLMREHDEKGRDG